MKNLLIGVTFVAVGVWYFQRVANDRARLPEPRDQGEIVIAKAPDGSLQGRWPGPTPVATRSK